MQSRATGALVALACAAALLTTAGPAGAAPARCVGQVPTIISDARTVLGTPGNDVIVVTGRKVEVRAGAGDDTICFRNPGGFGYVEAGTGDDVVRVEVDAYSIADLGPGRNTFRGGTGTDYVVSGSVGQPGRDRIDLGAGDDEVFLRAGTDHRRTWIRGGAGRDGIGLSVQRRGTLAVDAAGGTATLGGSAYASWQGFEAYVISARGRQVFEGTEGPDEVDFSGQGPVSAHTLGGDDVLSVLALGEIDPRGARQLDISADLGDGTDLLVVQSFADRVVGDLTGQRIELFPSDPEVTEPVGSFGFTGVEGLRVHASATAPAANPTTVTLVGDDGANVLEADACHVELRGGAGDDLLRVGNAPLTGALVVIGGEELKACRRTSVVRGDAGDDMMVSRALTIRVRGAGLGETVRPTEVPVRDLLDGGEGYDTARAGLGTDTCLAEVRVGCEA